MASSITVLAYHRVEAPGNPDLAPDLVEATPTQFEAQMRYLAARYNVVSSGDLVRALRDGYSLPSHALMITFDDAYASFTDTALPILRTLGLPVTLFAVTGYAGNPDKLFWWDELYRAITRTTEAHLRVRGLDVISLSSNSERTAAYERLVGIIERREAGEAERLLESITAACGVAPPARRYLLGWDDLRSMAEEGVAIGPHSRHHPILRRITAGALDAEVAGSWADLRSRIPSAVPIFCYPNGKPHAVDGTTARSVRQAGLVGAFTMVAGLNVIGRTDPFFLHRVGLEPGESLGKLAIKLTPAGRVYRRMKRLLIRGSAEDFTR